MLYLFLQSVNSLKDDPIYIVEMIENYPLRLLAFLKNELVPEHLKSFNIPYATPLSRYLLQYNIVEMYLDNILKSGDNSILPFEVISFLLLLYINIVYLIMFLNN